MFVPEQNQILLLLLLLLLMMMQILSADITSKQKSINQIKIETSSAGKIGEQNRRKRYAGRNARLEMIKLWKQFDTPPAPPQPSPPTISATLTTIRTTDSFDRTAITMAINNLAKESAKIETEILQPNKKLIPTTVQTTEIEKLLVPLETVTTSIVKFNYTNYFGAPNYRNEIVRTTATTTIGSQQNGNISLPPPPPLSSSSASSFKTTARRFAVAATPTTSSSSSTMQDAKSLHTTVTTSNITKSNELMLDLGLDSTYIPITNADYHHQHYVINHQQHSTPWHSQSQQQPQQQSIPNIVVNDIFSNHIPINFPSSSSSAAAAQSNEKLPSTASAVAMESAMEIPYSLSSSISSTPKSSSTIGVETIDRYACGVRPLRPTGRVVGGRNAQFGEWPWQVLIKESGWLGLFIKPKCGGVLIDDRWVLTAAHCQPGVMGSLIVMLGQHEANGERQTLKPVVKSVRRMIVHRDYNPETFDNDIALLELDSAFVRKPHVVPICMPDIDYDLVGQFAHVAGFGKLNYARFPLISSLFPGGSMPSILQTVKLPIIANDQCQKMFADAGHFKLIRESFLCAGYPQGGKDTCEGDSGGPLMIEHNGVWTLIGTVSHGIKCAEPNMPGVYMKTFAYLPWIRGIMGRKL